MENKNKNKHQEKIRHSEFINYFNNNPDKNYHREYSERSKAFYSCRQQIEYVIKIKNYGIYTHDYNSCNHYIP